MIKINSYFKDNCVIQANKQFILEGQSDNKNSTVFIELSSDKNNYNFTTTCNENGYFCCDLGVFEPSFTEFTLSVNDGKDSLKITKIVFGDVYLGLGQSNLELRLKYLKDYEKTIEKFKNYNFRFLTAENITINYANSALWGINKPCEDFLDDFKWENSTSKEASENSYGFTYIFCGEMAKKVKYPVACINLAVGGSTVLNWLPKELIRKFDLENKDDGNVANKKDYELFNGQTKIGCIYNEKVYPLRNLPFKGALWYLGESSCFEGYDRNTRFYSKLFKVLINHYRSLFRNDLPFILVDIGMEAYNEFEVSYVNEQHSIISKENENVVNCPIFDLSHQWVRPDGNVMYHPIHLVDKEQHAKRACQLFYNAFIKKNGKKCPTIEKITYKKYSVECKINTTSKLRVKDGKAIFGFTVAGENGIYEVCKAEFTGNDTITVYSENIENPKHVCYGFMQYNNYCNVFNDDFPLIPFRSDIENADNLKYAFINPAFLCTYDKAFESAFSTLCGGSNYVKTYGISQLFGSKKAKLQFLNDCIYLAFNYDPKNACLVGINPNVNYCEQANKFENYNYFSIELESDNDLEFTGVHFRLSNGKQFFCIPQINGENVRNHLLKGKNRTKLLFDFTSCVSKMENIVPLTSEDKSLICKMQITFRNYKETNGVKLYNVSFFNKEDKKQNLEYDTNNKSENIFNYGK